jgi:hypothetical protein
MKSEQFLLAAGALLLVWSMRSEAHNSYEAVMEGGGNLLQLTRAVLHPLFEIPDLPALLISVLILGFVFGPVILHIVRQREANKAEHSHLSEKPAVAPKAKNH